MSMKSDKLLVEKNDLTEDVHRQAIVRTNTGLLLVGPLASRMEQISEEVE